MGTYDYYYPSPQNGIQEYYQQTQHLYYNSANIIQRKHGMITNLGNVAPEEFAACSRQLMAAERLGTGKTRATVGMGFLH